MSASLIRQDLVPVTVGYVLIMGTLAAGLLIQRRDRAAVPGMRAEPGPAESPAGSGTVAPGWRAWRRLIRHLVATFADGYVVLMAVVIAYYYGVARVSGNFLESAFTGCALPLGLSSPVFLAASWLAERRDRRRSARGRIFPAPGRPVARHEPRPADSGSREPGGGRPDTRRAGLAALGGVVTGGLDRR